MQFNFAAIQLNQLSWRDYLTQQNPVAAALMSKMNIAPSERPRVKAECLRLLITLQLDPALMQLISGFVDTYLNLNAQEEQVFETTIDRMGLNDEQQEEYMEIVTSWERKGAEKIAMNSLRKGMTVEDIAEITELSIERVRELQAQLQKEN